MTTDRASVANERQKTLTEVSDASDLSDVSEGCFRNFFHLL